MGYISPKCQFKNYYPFGMLMDARTYTSEAYRYGFNGKENDDEISGEGNNLDFGARIYDSRLGRWMSVDPFVSKYPSLSPFTFVANSVLIFVDLDGKKIDLSKLTADQLTIYNARLKELNSSEIFRNMYEELEKADRVFVISFNESVNGGYSETSEGEGENQKVVYTIKLPTVGQNAQVKGAQEMFHAYQRIDKSKNLTEGYGDGDYEAEGEIFSYAVAKQIEVDYRPMGETRFSIEQGTPKFENANLFTEDQPIWLTPLYSEHIDQENFNALYQEYKVYFEDFAKSRSKKLNPNNPNADDAYDHVIGKMTNKKAEVFKSLLPSKPTKENESEGTNEQK
jgi:RHS repeat-associated protein